MNKRYLGVFIWVLGCVMVGISLRSNPIAIICGSIGCGMVGTGIQLEVECQEK